MKIFILVLIFSLLNKLNCQKIAHEPAEDEEGAEIKEVLNEKQEEELKEILTDKADANGVPVNKQEPELQEDPADKVETEALQVDEEEDEIKQNAELKEILTDKEQGLQEDPADKVDIEVPQVKEEEDKKIDNLPEPPDEAQNAELKEVLTDKNPELQEDPADKNPELQEDPADKNPELQEDAADKNPELQEDPADKVDAEVLQDEKEKEKEGDEIKQDAELQEDTADKQDPELPKGLTDKVDEGEVQDDGDKKGDEVKNNETVQTCEDCTYEKQKYNKEEEEAGFHKLPVNQDDNKLPVNQDEKVKKALNIFPSGDIADLFGNNQHYKIPDNYQDFGRRFVLQYPYTKIKSIDEQAEDDLHNAVEQYIENKEDSQGPLPIKAPPEFVLEIAKRSLLLEKTKPKNPTDDIIHKDILRSGNYWNDVQKEEVDPKKILRSTDSKYNLESVKVEIKPGSKLYSLISRLKEKSPRLLYVINKNID